MTRWFSIPLCVLFLSVFSLLNAAEPKGILVSTPSETEAQIGALIVELPLASGEHTYSTTQAKVPGGYPTTITVTPEMVETDWGRVTFGSFSTASPMALTDFYGATLEELVGVARFYAPIFLNPPQTLSPEELSALLSSLKLEGEYDGLCCTEENCRPLRQGISFHWDPQFDSSAVIAQVIENLERLSPVDEIPLFTGNLSSDLRPAPSASEREAQASGFGKNLLWDLLLAFFGGMILNIMPCVLPVIGLKIIGFFEQAGHSRARALKLNLFYCAGILLVFAVLATMSVGLSYLFTYGLFQIVMGGIVFMMALNLMGVWEIPLPAFLGGSKSNELMRREGAFGALFKGIVTTLLAIPCGAPLLSPVLVWTDSMIQQNRTVMAMVVYLVIGFGMATPYLILGAFPEWLKILPKPGLWMEKFRHIMGFVLLAAVLWILFSMPLEFILPTIALLFTLWFVCWWLGERDEYGLSHFSLRRTIVSVCLILLVIGTSFRLDWRVSSGETIALNPYTLQGAVEGKLSRWAIRAGREGKLEQKQWRLFSQSDLDHQLSIGKTVLVDFTADWCMNCKVLENTVLHQPDLTTLLEQRGIVTMTADWTSRDQTPDGREAGELLRRYGGEQVPVVMIFRPGSASPVILRGMFTTQTLMEALK